MMDLLLEVQRDYLIEKNEDQKENKSKVKLKKEKIKAKKSKINLSKP